MTWQYDKVLYPRHGSIRDCSCDWMVMMPCDQLTTSGHVILRVRVKVCCFLTFSAEIQTSLACCRSMYVLPDSFCHLLNPAIVCRGPVYMQIFTTEWQYGPRLCGLDPPAA